MAKEKTLILSRRTDESLEAMTGSFLTGTYAKSTLASCADSEFLSTIHTHDADWIVVLDGGAFLTVPSRLEGLLEFMVENDYHCCGMPDGGVVPARAGSPLVFNPFFLIVNAKKLRIWFKRKPIPETPFDPAYQNDLPKHLLRGDYSLAAKKPYDFFSYSLRKKGAKLLALDAIQWVRDGGTTILSDHERRPFLLHTWATDRFSEQKPRFDQAQKFSLLVQEQLKAAEPEQLKAAEPEQLEPQGS